MAGVIYVTVSVSFIKYIIFNHISPFEMLFHLELVEILYYHVVDRYKTYVITYLTFFFFLQKLDRHDFSFSNEKLISFS